MLSYCTGIPANSQPSTPRGNQLYRHCRGIQQFGEGVGWDSGLANCSPGCDYCQQVRPEAHRRKTRVWWAYSIAYCRMNSRCGIGLIYHVSILQIHGHRHWAGPDSVPGTSENYLHWSVSGMCDSSRQRDPTLGIVRCTTPSAQNSSHYLPYMYSYRYCQ